MEGDETYYVIDYHLHYLTWAAQRGRSVRWLRHSVNLSHPDYVAMIAAGGAALYGWFWGLLALASKTPVPGAFVAKSGGGELRAMTPTEMASACHFVVLHARKVLQQLVTLGLIARADHPSKAAQVVTSQRRSAQRVAQRMRSRCATRARTREEVEVEKRDTPPNPPSRGGGRLSRADRRRLKDEADAARVLASLERSNG